MGVDRCGRGVGVTERLNWSTTGRSSPTVMAHQQINKSNLFHSQLAESTKYQSPQCNLKATVNLVQSTWHRGAVGNKWWGLGGLGLGWGPHNGPPICHRSAHHVATGHQFTSTGTNPMERSGQKGAEGSGSVGRWCPPKGGGVCGARVRREVACGRGGAVITRQLGPNVNVSTPNVCGAMSCATHAGKICLQNR